MFYLIFILIIIALVVWVIFLQKKIKSLEGKVEAALKEKEEVEDSEKGLGEHNLKMRERKGENKMKIINLLEQKDKITNDEVEQLLNISDATATNYLEELEQEGKVEQVGKKGRFVYYRLKING